MAKKYCAGAILAILTLAACGGEYTPSKEEAEIIQSLEKGNKITSTVKDTCCQGAKFTTEFIALPEGRVIKEKKVFEIYDEFILIDGDTINRDGDLGYIVIGFPYKQVKSFPVKYHGTGTIELGDLLYSMNLPRPVKSRNNYTIVKGDTRKVLLNKGIPSHKIPKVPQVGQIITW
jgi:hypothetical protein